MRNTHGRQQGFLKQLRNESAKRVDRHSIFANIGNILIYFAILAKLFQKEMFSPFLPPLPGS